MSSSEYMKDHTYMYIQTLEWAVKTQMIIAVVYTVLFENNLV